MALQILTKYEPHSYHFPIGPHDRCTGTNTAASPASRTRAGETAGAAVVLLDARTRAEVVSPHHGALLRHGIVRHRRRHRRRPAYGRQRVHLLFIMNESIFFAGDLVQRWHY